MYHKNLSLKDAENEQEKMLVEIEELEEKTEPFRRKTSETNKGEGEEVFGNAKRLYDVRGKIIKTIGQIKEKKDLDWIKNYDLFKELEDTVDTDPYLKNIYNRENKRQIDLKI